MDNKAWVDISAKHQAILRASLGASQSSSAAGVLRPEAHGMAHAAYRGSRKEGSPFASLVIVVGVVARVRAPFVGC